MGNACGQKFDFSEHGHVAYQIEGDNEYNRIQVKFSTKDQTGDHGVGSKGQILLNFFRAWEFAMAPIDCTFYF